MSTAQERYYRFTAKNEHYLFDTECGFIFPAMENSRLVNSEIGTNEKNDGINCQDKELEQEELDYLEQLSNIYKFEAPDKESNIRKHNYATENEWLDGKVLNKMAFSLAHNCNMKCAYCFADDGTYGLKSMMTTDMAKQCIEFFFKYASSKAGKFNVNYFGGEPLLNKKVFIYATKLINDKAKERNTIVRYTVTTNGTIMDEDILNLIIENNMHLNFSMDGAKETQNRNRTFANGQPTFDKVMETLDLFRKRNYWNMTARLTLTKSGVKTLKDDIQFLWNQGFTYIMIDIVRTDIEEVALDEDSIQEFKNQMAQLLEIVSTQKNKLLRNLSDMKYFIENRLLKSECMYFNSNTIQFTPEGEIYKCSFTVGDREHCVGNITNGIQWNKLKSKFEPSQNCYVCWAKRLCGGGCSLNRNKISCEYFKVIMENSLKYYAISNKIQNI